MPQSSTRALLYFLVSPSTFRQLYRGCDVPVALQQTTFPDVATATLDLFAWLLPSFFGLQSTDPLLP